MKKLYAILLINFCLSCTDSVTDTVNDDFVSKVVYKDSVFTKKVLLFDFTGTWCQYCPSIALEVDEILQTDSLIIPMSVHQGDVYALSNADEICQYYKITGFPTAIANISNNWSGDIESLNYYKTNTKATVGIQIDARTKTTDVTTVKVRVAFKKNIKTSLNFSVAIVEDSLIANQANSVFKELGNPIVGFAHMAVLRQYLTSYKGDAVPIDSIRNYYYSKSYSIAIQNYKYNKTSVVVYVFNSSTNEMLNVQKVHLGKYKTWLD